MRHRWFLILGSALILSSSFGKALAAAPPYRVKDLNPLAHNAGSDPRRFLTLQSGIGLFLADDGETGLDLWRSDGTSAGTFRLTDGACGASCRSRELLLPWAQAGDRAFIFSLDEQGNNVLWVTDGSRPGTFPILVSTFIPPGQRPLWVESLGLLFFVVGNETTRAPGLWCTDGTPAGTRLVKDFGVDASGWILNLTEFRGRVYFHAGDDRGPSLWASDGTAAGTVLVRDPWLGVNEHQGPSLIRAVGSRLLFFAQGPGFGNELWVSDGTTRGTRPISDLVPGPGGPQVFDAVAAGGLLYFLADTGRGPELGVSNGTRAGTRMLTDFPSQYAFDDGLFLPRQPLLGGRFYFQADDSVHGTEIWSTDGTRAGTKLLRDLCPGSCPGATGVLNVLGNALLFGSDDGVHGVELWRSDGTAKGTRLVRDLCPGACSSFPGPAWRAGSRLLLAAYSPTSTRQLWRTDGTKGGTVPISSFPRGVTDSFTGQLPGALLLRAWDAGHGDELWISNGTRPGTRLLKDIRAGIAGGSSPRLLTPLDPGLLFLANAPAPTGEIQAGFWMTDGTAAGTIPIATPPNCLAANEVLPFAGQAFLLFCTADGGFALMRAGGGVPEPVLLTPPGVSLLSPREAVVSGGSVFFVGKDGTSNRELWISDGVTEARRVADLVPALAGAEPTDLAPFQGRVLFRAGLGESGFDLWASDGTAAGTKQLTRGDVRPDLLGEHGGRFWFAAGTPEAGQELWSTDGTEEGTRMLADFTPDLEPERLVSAGTRMFLAASTGLWASDGTPAGTHRVSGESLRPGSSPYEANARAGAGVLFYTTYLQVEGEVLWQSDGTEAGTGPVLGSAGNGGLFRSPQWLTLFGDRLYFLWQGELWSTDGTPTGAAKIDTPEAPGVLTRAGSRLFFRATDPEHGMELWAMEP